AALSNVREERRAIEQKILDETYKQHRMALEATLASQTSSAPAKLDALDQLAKLDQNKALDQQRLDRDYESPVERYRRELIGYGANLNDELEKVAVGALDTLSDRLANIAFGARNAMDALKGVFKQIGI